jgi:transposase
MTSQRKKYPSDLSDEEWNIIASFIPQSNSNKRRGGRPEKYAKREVLNAILYVMSSGCRWCDMPHDLPPGGISWYYFNVWSKRKLIKKIAVALRKQVRLKREKNESPSVLIIDSQTAKGLEYIDDSGYDAGKKIKGRKRHHLTDTQGLLIHTIVHSAALQDRDGAKLLLKSAGVALCGIVKIYADGGYTGKLITWVWQKFGIVLEIVKRSELHKFVVLPKRWIIERTNAWISDARRLVREYEKKVCNQESMIYLRMIQLMVRWVI